MEKVFQMVWWNAEAGDYKETRQALGKWLAGTRSCVDLGGIR
jgi:hypothetical protein